MKKLRSLFILTIFSTCIFAQVPAYVPTNGLVGWWPFTGNANDLSVNGNNGTVYGATLTSDRNANLNSAYNFNGMNTFIEVNSTSLLQLSNSYSIGLWFNPSINNNNLPYGYTLLSKITPSGWYGGYEIMLGTIDPTPNGIVLHVGNINSSNFQLGPHSGVSQGNWYFIVITFDGSTLKLYFNGLVVVTLNQSGSLQTGNDPLRFGRRGGVGLYNQWYNGSIDDIGIWNRALTACEITQLYTSGISPITTTTSAATICAGASTTITASGATTYAWMPVYYLTGATITVSPTSTTTYTVTGTSNGCINTATRIITVNPLPVVTATSTAAAVCVGGSVTLTGGGATSYVWSGGVTNAVSFIPTATTTYTVTGTNINGCVNTATITVTVNPLPVVTTTTTAPSICIGASTTITANGATTYAWMPGNLTGATITVSPTATTTYTVTGTNANGCVNTATRIITVNPLPIVTATSTAASVCTGSNVTLTGGGATSYTWSGGVTNAVSFIPTATTTYTVTGTNINGCVNTATITVTVNPLPVVTATSTAASVCAGASVTLTGGGATSYSWSGGVTNAVSFIPTATTTYTVTGTNINGCVNTAAITVTVNPLPVVTATSTAPSICLGGSVTLAANGASNYNWMPGNISGFLVSVSPTATTTYTVTGTNINGCVNTATITVTVNPLPVVTATSTAPSICIGGSVTLAANGASNYNWMPGNLSGFLVSVSPTATTTYTVTGTNANACVNTATITVIVNPLPLVTANSSAASVCTGSSVTLTGGGAATYTWDNNVTDAVSFVPTATTTYMVTGTDVNGCVNTAMTTVTVNPLPVVTANSSSAAVCIGASVTLTGGGASTYTWDNNVIDAISFIPTATTTYMVIGTDTNACVNTAMITVTVNPLPIVTATSSAAAVCTGGSVTLTGGGAATYTWDNNVIDAVSFVPSATTTYMVTGTDVNGCVNTATTTVTLSGLLIISLGPDIIQCGGTALLDAGNMGSTFLWNNASTTQTITVSASGTYIVVVTDVNGCNGSDTAVVTINSNPSVSAAASSSVVCVDDADVSLIGTPIGGVWSGPGVNGLLLNPTAAGVGLQSAVYSYTDVNGCEGMDSVSIQVNACVGINEISNGNLFSVYPNPATNEINVKADASLLGAVYNVFDNAGKVVLTGKIIFENTIIELGNLSSGVYMLNIGDNLKQTFKVIKE